MNEYIDKFISEGILVSESLKHKHGIDFNGLFEYVKRLDEKPFLIDDKIINEFNNQNNFFEKDINNNIKVDVSPVQLRDKGLAKVEVIKSYDRNNKMRNMTDWYDFYQHRFNTMKKMLEHRQELRNASSINSIIKMTGRNEVSTIALVKEVRRTKNDNILVELEDPTGTIKGLINSNKEKVMAMGEELVPDEVIGVVGTRSGIFLFISDVVFPDAPNNKELVMSNVDEYACFIADTHVGSVDFEKKMYDNFVSWLKGKNGTKEQKEIAKKVKYLFVIGDLVDGVGIYPRQDKELEIKDIYKQYEKFADYLKDLPEDIQLIFIPGNHDALRQSEPQPPLFSDIAKPVFELSNVKNLSNPSTIKIGATGEFQGLNVLMYHGYSYTYYATNVNKLIKIGMDKPDSISEFLLKKRHLGPTHTSSLITPEAMDPLIIESVPDVLVTGHIHTLGHRRYKSTNIIASSCFQKMTSFMQKLGHHPTPGFVPLLNLKTRNIKVMNFT